MRKLQRSVLRHKAEHSYGCRTIIFFHRYWKELRKKQGKRHEPKFRENLILKKRKKSAPKQSQAKITYTGNKMVKLSLWQKIKKVFKKLFGGS